MNQFGPEATFIYNYDDSQREEQSLDVMGNTQELKKSSQQG